MKLNREALQGRPKVCKGARSATNVYAYDYSFARRAIVATLDLSAKNLSAFHNDHWLSNKLNVIVLDIAGRKAYKEVVAAALPPLQTVPEAELFFVVVVLRHAGPRLDVVLDCDNVLTGLRRGRAYCTAARRPLAGAWCALWDLLAEVSWAVWDTAERQNSLMI